MELNDLPDNVCPLLSMGGKGFVPCIMHKCNFFVGVYTAEGHPVRQCSIALIANMNSEGKLAV